MPPPADALIAAWLAGEGRRFAAGDSVSEVASALDISPRSARTLREWWAAGGPPRKVTRQFRSVFDRATTAQTTPPEPTPERGGLRILVVGDAHFAPRQDLWRASALGRAIRDLAPDVVVCIGDWADMPSLSAYDKGRRSFEGRRYVADIAAGNDALQMMHAELGDWKGRLVWTVGNHEQRIERVGDTATELDGLVSLDDIDFRRRGWEVFPFRKPVSIGGVQFAHYFASGVMGRAISGVSPARSLVVKTHTSCIQGHSHLLDYHRETAPDGRVAAGLHVGCFFDHHEEWAGEANKLYWRGLVLLDDVAGGTYDLRTIGIEAVRRRWGC